MIDLLAATCGGFAAHQTKPVLDKAIRAEGWNRLVSYTVGVVTAYPFVELLTMRLLGEFSPAVDRRRVGMALRTGYFVAYLFFGIGTATAWLWSVLRGSVE